MEFEWGYGAIADARHRNSGAMARRGWGGRIAR
jgi:hypothetical protein